MQTKLNGISMVLCFVTIIAAVLLSLGAAGPQSEAESEHNLRYSEYRVRRLT